MANPNSTYKNETDFLEWYRNRYGKEYDGSPFAIREGMSEDDYEIGQGLYSSYLNKQKRTNDFETSKSQLEKFYGAQEEQFGSNKDYSIGVAERQAQDSLSKLEQYYKTTGEALDKSKRQSQQNASITLDKLKKYLPTQIKAQGLGGLGVSESTMLKAYNNYNSDMGAIESDYQQNKSTLETNYQDNKRGIESDRDSAINAANKSYDDSVAKNKIAMAQDLSELERAYNSANDDALIESQNNASDIMNKYQTRYLQQQKNAYEEAKGILALNQDGSLEDLMGIVETYKGITSDEDYQNLTNLAQNLANKHKTDTEQSSFGNYSVMADNIKADSGYYTPEEIDMAVERRVLTEDDGSRLKGLIKDTAIQEIQPFIDSGSYESAISEATKAYKAKKFDEDTYQSLVYDIAIRDCSSANTVSTVKEKDSNLLKLKNEGKLSQADYTNAKNYLYQNSIKTLPSGSYSSNNAPYEGTIKITYNGKVYNLLTADNWQIADSDTQSVLNAAYNGNPNYGALAEINGQLYVYKTFPSQTNYCKNGWTEVSYGDFWAGGTNNKEFYKVFENATQNATVNPATHNSTQNNVSSSTSGSGASFPGTIGSDGKTTVYAGYSVSGIKQEIKDLRRRNSNGRYTDLINTLQQWVNENS